MLWHGCLGVASYNIWYGKQRSTRCTKTKHTRSGQAQFRQRGGWATSLWPSYFSTSGEYTIPWPLRVCFATQTFHLSISLQCYMLWHGCLGVASYTTWGLSNIFMTILFFYQWRIYNTLSSAKHGILWHLSISLQCYMLWHGCLGVASYNIWYGKQRSTRCTNSDNVGAEQHLYDHPIFLPVENIQYIVKC
jgi:hypothetical protein